MVTLIALMVISFAGFGGETKETGELLPMAQPAPRRPMPIDYSYPETTNNHWLNKPVLESRLLDDMESPSHWVSRGACEMSFTAERAIDGRQSVRLRSKTKGRKKGGFPMGNFWSATSVIRTFAGEDWSKFNRLSFWVYPDLPGFNTTALLVGLRNEGPERGWPGNWLMLRNQEWNHVVWEIPDLAREKVTGVFFTYWQQGNEPGATDTVQFDIDHLELQRVDADYYEGWSVAPGRISFSHTGYQTNAPKRAIASDLKASEFQLISQDNGKIVLAKAIQPVESRIGRFQVLDFTEINTPGVYILKAGDATTLPFRIDPNVWRDTILKVINFFYAERCGFAVPGVHGVCHQDWQGVHRGKRIIINGGWHDAGDLSQGLVNTSEAVYSMFALADRLQTNGQDPELAKRLIEEATWGLDWVMKVSFGDGYRITWATMRFWSDGIPGNVDDVTIKARNSPFENFLSAAAEAIGARVLKNEYPSRAERGLQMAKADWQFAVEGMKKTYREGTDPDDQGSLTETAGAGILASVDLYRLTSENKYEDEAVRLAGLVLDAQQRSFLPGVKPAFAGFFYTNPKKSRLVHYFHRGHEQSPVVALARLCETFPNHPDYMKWYSAVLMHSEYFQAQMAAFTEPYRHLPNGLYKSEDVAGSGEFSILDLIAFRAEPLLRDFGGGIPAAAVDRKTKLANIVRQQVHNGWNLGGDYYLRMYPVQLSPSLRGNFGTSLSQAKAVAAAAHLRGRLELADLVQDQLHWVVGRNPFVQSTMYGEGYDYAPQYSAMSGDIIGSLPVGIKMLGNNDLPYWPATDCWNYKEVWVHPASRWLWLMEDVAGPAVVKGRVKPKPGEPAKFRDVRTGYSLDVEPDLVSGQFRAEVPEGRYEVTVGSLKKNVTLLPGQAIELDLRPESFLDFDVASDTDLQGAVTITLTARGQGSHSFGLRTDNLNVAQSKQTLDLQSGTSAKIIWQGMMASTGAPWVAVVVPDGKLDQKQEVFGATDRKKE